MKRLREEPEKVLGLAIEIVHTHLKYNLDLTRPVRHVDALRHQQFSAGHRPPTVSQIHFH